MKQKRTSGRHHLRTEYPLCPTRLFLPALHLLTGPAARVRSVAHVRRSRAARELDPARTEPKRTPPHQCYHHRELPCAGPIPSRAPLPSSLLSSASSSSSSPPPHPPASAARPLHSHPRGNPNPLLAQDAYDGDSPRARRERIRDRAAAADVLGHVEPCHPIDGPTPRHPPCSRATYDLSPFFHVFQFLQHLWS